jgi:hypothetical protein
MGSKGNDEFPLKIDARLVFRLHQPQNINQWELNT